MTPSEFHGAMAVYEGRDFAIRLTDGTCAVWWNRNLALGHERYVELHRLLDGLAESGDLPDYAGDPERWLAANVFDDVSEEAVPVTSCLALDFHPSPAIGDDLPERMLDVILAVLGLEDPEEIKVALSERFSRMAASGPNLP